MCLLQGARFYFVEKNSGCFVYHVRQIVYRIAPEGGWQSAKCSAYSIHFTSCLHESNLLHESAKNDL